MRLYAFLILASYALHARGAAVPDVDVRDIEKKLITVAKEVTKKDVVPVENSASEQELIDQSNAVNEVENNLRVKPVDIPVKIVVEDVQPALKTEKKEEDPIKTEETPDIKRVEIDLNNPGKPQRQEHETQNPEHFEEPVQVNVKKFVDDTQVAINEGFQRVGQGIQNILPNGLQFTNFQQGLQTLQDSFMEQLDKLNKTVTSYFPSGESASPEEATAQKKGIEKVQAGLRTLENNFQNAVKSISNGVQAYGTQKAEGDAPAPAPANNNFLVVAFQNLQNTLSQGFTNVTQAFQGAFSGTPGSNNAQNQGSGSFITGIGNSIQNLISPPAAAQSDEGATPTRPQWPFFQGIQNILTNGQSQAQGDTPATPNQPGPVLQAIQNNPIYQGVVSLIQPNRPATQPAAVAPEKPAADATNQQAGSNDVPVAVPAPVVPVAPVAPVAPVKTTEEQKPQVQDGPIKKIIQNNPIVKGISGAVQKIQSLANPEKPRDTLEGEEVEKDEKKDEKNESDVKGGLIFVGGHGGGHGGHGGANREHNNDVGGVENVEPEKVEQQGKKTPEVEPEKVVEKVEKQPETPEVPVTKTE